MTRDNALALEVAEATGLRIGDVLKIEKKALKSPDTITYKAQKTGKKGEKKITPELFDRLERSGNMRWCFPSPRNGRKKRTRQAVWADMHKLKKRGEGRVPSPHSARKAYAVRLAFEKGIAAVGVELQHTHQDTTMIYAMADVLEERLRAAEENTSQMGSISDEHSPPYPS